MRPHSAKKLLVPSGVASQDVELFHSKFKKGACVCEQNKIYRNLTTQKDKFNNTQKVQAWKLHEFLF